MSIYKIHEDNIARLEAKLQRIEKKCSKLGCSYIYNKVGEVYEEVTDAEGRTSMAKFIEIEVEGKAIINDWEVIARVDHESNGVVISKVRFDVELPAKYTLSDYNHCEHCNSRRNRKVVYVLRHTVTDEWKQVGASCLREFTNGLDAEMAASYLAMFDEFVEWDYVAPTSGYKQYYPIKDYLRYCVECISKFGWTSKNAGYSTAERAWEYFMLKEYNSCWSIQAREAMEEQMASVNFNANTAENAQVVDNAIKFILESEADSDYMLTLQTLASSDYFRSKFDGFVASMIKCYNNHLDKLKKEGAAKKAAEENPSKHVGSVGDRITCDIESVECVTSWDTMYGITFLYKLVDKSGNILMWKTSNWLELDNFKYTKVTCTTKAHSEFQGVAQTEVTRCKFAA